MPRLLVINPNTTASVTELVSAFIRKAVGETIEVVSATGRFGCAYISSEGCYAVAAHAVLDCYGRAKSFSIVTGGTRWKPMLERFASEIGLRQSLASVRTISLTGGQIAADPDAAIGVLASACEAAATDDGVNAALARLLY